MCSKAVRYVEPCIILKSATFGGYFNDKGDLFEEDNEKIESYFSVRLNSNLHRMPFSSLSLAPSAYRSIA